MASRVTNSNSRGRDSRGGGMCWTETPILRFRGDGCEGRCWRLIEFLRGERGEGVFVRLRCESDGCVSLCVGDVLIIGTG